MLPSVLSGPAAVCGRYACCPVQNAPARPHALRLRTRGRAPRDSGSRPTHVRTRAVPELLGAGVNAAFTTSGLGEGLSATDVQSTELPSWLTSVDIPPWYGLFGLLALNASVLWLVNFVAAVSADGSEAVSVITLQVGLLLGSSNLQQRLLQLREMLSIGQRGQWVTLEETVQELHRKRGSIKYARAESTVVGSKREAYALFTSAAEKREQQAVAAEADAEPGHASEPLRLPWQGIRGDEEAIVVTLVVLARGDLPVPPVKSGAELHAVLQMLRDLQRKQLLGIELLWTPESANDHLSTARMLQDYPGMAVLA